MRRGSLGANSIDVSIGGSLNVDLGFAGISDGVTEGTMQVTAAGSISLAGSTAGAWHAFEFSVSGTSCTFYLTALAGETDESFMSLTMKGYWSAAKLGYYRIASRRVLAFVYVRTGPVLGRIVNTSNGSIGFRDITICDSKDFSGTLYRAYRATLISQIGAWNMQAAGGGVDVKLVPLPVVFSAGSRITGIKAVIFSDTGAQESIEGFQNSADPQLVAGGCNLISTSTLRLYRRTGGLWDNAACVSVLVNRGYVTIEWET
jgi:hypothetical protein